MSSIEDAGGATGADASTSSTGDWFEALARAWGDTLDAQAQKLTDLADQVRTGAQQPSDYAMLTAESQRLNFLSTSAATSVNSVGQAIETMARKQ